MNKNWVVFLGAGRFQLSSIIKAKELGYNIISFDANPSAPGYIYSNLFFDIDIKNYKLIYSKIKEIKIKPTKIINICTEIGVRSQIALTYLFKHKSDLKDLNQILKNNLFITNKYYQRKLFKNQKNFKIPKFTILKYPDLNKYKFDNKKIIIKPTDSSGSKGIVVKKKLNKLSYKEFTFSQKFSLERKVILEEFIEGVEYTVETIVDKNIAQILLINKKIKRKKTDGTVTQTYVTLTNKDNLFYKLKKAAIEIILNYSNIRNSYYHIEFIVNKLNEVFLVEFATRGPGFHVFDKFIPFVTGFDMVKNNLLNVLDKKTEKFKYKHNKYALIHFYTSNSKKNSVQIKLNNQYKFTNVDLDFGMFISKKKSIINKNTDEDRLGYIMIKNNDYKILLKDFKRVKDNIIFF